MNQADIQSHIGYGINRVWEETRDDPLLSEEGRAKIIRELDEIEHLLKAEGAVLVTQDQLQELVRRAVKDATTYDANDHTTLGYAEDTEEKRLHLQQLMRQDQRYQVIEFINSLYR